MPSNVSIIKRNLCPIERDGEGQASEGLHSQALKCAGDVSGKRPLVKKSKLFGTIWIDLIPWSNLHALKVGIEAKPQGIDCG